MASLSCSIWPEIHAATKGKATLDIYYGRQTWGAMNEDDMNKKILVKIRDLQNAGMKVIERGKIGHLDLADTLIQEISILTYPCTTAEETYCISIVKAHAAGCIPVTVRQGCFKETVSPGAPTIQEIKTMDDVEKYKQLLLDVLKNINHYDSDEIRKKFIDFAENKTWKHCVDSWLKLIKLD